MEEREDPGTSSSPIASPFLRGIGRSAFPEFRETEKQNEHNELPREPGKKQSKKIDAAPLHQRSCSKRERERARGRVRVRERVRERV